MTSVHRACANGDIAVFETLAKFPGIDFNYDSRGESPLTIAIKAGHPDISQYLLGLEGINVNARRMNFDTALIAAVRAGEKALVERLLAVPGIEVNSRGSENMTALALAKKAVNEYRAAQQYTPHQVRRTLGDRKPAAGEWVPRLLRPRHLHSKYS